MKQTAISAAFVKAGMPRHVLALYAPIAAFIAAGGTRDELLAAYDAIAKRVPGKQAAHDDEFASGKGQHGAIEHDQFQDANPVREPSRGHIEAAARVSKNISRSILDWYEIRGQAVGNLRIGELRSVGDSCRADAMVADRLREYCHMFHPNADELATVRQLVPAADVEKIVRQVRGIVEDE